MVTVAGQDRRLGDVAAAGNRAIAGLFRAAAAADPGGGPLDPEVGAAIEAGRGGGSPLPEAVRAEMEHHLGVDLGAVRLHTDEKAAGLNRSVAAEAFTSGTDVFFAGGPDLSSSGGRELLAHELTHVAQQVTGTVSADSRVSHPDEAAEVEARSVARRIAASPTDADAHGTAPAPADRPHATASRAVFRDGPTPAASAAARRTGFLQTSDFSSDVEILLRDVPEIMHHIGSVRWDADALAAGATDATLHPPGVVVYTESHIVLATPDGRPSDITRQAETPTMFNAQVIVLRDDRSGRVWFLGVRDHHWELQTVGDVAGIGDEHARPGASTLMIYLPGVALKADVVARLTRRANVAQPVPGWAHAAARELADQAGTGTGTSGTGPGAGRHGTGTGGGGTDPTGTGGSGGTAGPGDHAGHGDHGGHGGHGGHGDRAGDHTGQTAGAALGGQDQPLHGPAAYRAEMGEDGNPYVRVTIDRATILVPLHPGERPGELRGRVDARIAELQASRDPDQHQNAGTATRTGFTGAQQHVRESAANAERAPGGQGPGAAGERVEGGAPAANALGYPATISMAGAPADATTGNTAPGATNAFTMTLDYASRSLGMQDEVWNRLQDVHYVWELYDVSHIAEEQREPSVRRARVGTGQVVNPGSGDAADLRREFHSIAEDEDADLAMMSEQRWPWQARAAYLAAIGVSNDVRILGAAISSYVALVTRPLNERPISFAQPGEYLVRCVATPVAGDAAMRDPEHHVIRASSVQVFPVRVQPLGAAAARVADGESRALSELEAALAAAERSGDQEAIAAARAKLELARRGARAGGFEAYENELGALRRQVEVAHRVQQSTRQRVPEEQWEIEDLELLTALVARGHTIEEYVPQIERALQARTGEGGTFERWVREQHRQFAGADHRPVVAFASEENGQVSELKLILGEHTGSDDGHRHWTLVDITSASNNDLYEGRSSVPGHAGQVAAIRDAFRSLAEAAPYGRGTLAIRLPATLAEALGAPVEIEPSMRAAKGASGRALQRLADLAKAAEFAGLFVTGPVGVALGVIGGLAGAAVAVDSLMRRSRTGHVYEVGTIFDILGVIGGAVSVGGVAASVGRRAGAVQRFMHYHGVVNNLQQIVSIPLELAESINAIQNDPSLSEGQRRARAALAVLRGLKSGMITVVQAARTHEQPAAAPPEGAGAPGEPHGGPAEPHGTPAQPHGTPAEPHGTPAEPGEHNGPQPGAGPEPTVPSEADVVARARRLGEQRTRQSVEAEQRAAGGGEHGEQVAPEVDPDGGGQRTTMGTGGEPGGPGRTGTPADSAQRDLALTRLTERLGAPRRPPAHPGPAPPPGDYGPRTTRAEEALARYDEAVARSPHAEVGLFYHPDTGEFAVRVGTDASVSGPHGDGWQALVHLHPNPDNVITYRLPAPADVYGTMMAAFRTGEHTEFVESRHPDGTVGITKVTAHTDPMRILVETPATATEPARTIEVTDLDAYAREYGSETTHLDPSSPLYRWVLRDLDNYYRARRQFRPRGGGERTTAGTAAATPSTRERLSATRPDVAERFDAADQRWAAAGGTGQAPSGAFDVAMQTLEGGGFTPAGRAAVDALFARPEPGQDIRSGQFRSATELLVRAAELVRERPDTLQPRSLDRQHQTLVGQGHEVAEAYRRGQTVDGRPIRTADAPELAAAMRAMDEAFTAHRDAAATDPVARLVGLELLRGQVARAREVLRSYDARFTSESHGDELPGLARPGQAEQPHQARSREIADEAAGADVRRKPAAQLLEMLRFGEPETVATGVVGQSLDRRLPGMGLNRYALTPGDIRALLTRPPALAARLADILSGYHEAHLIGPGFGAELFEGMMLAPAGLNLDAQNEGVEHFIRSATNAGVEVTLEARVKGTRLAIPLEGGGFEYVDVLTEVSYTIHRPPTAGPPLHVTLAVTAPPRGTWRVIRNDIPAAAPGGNVLANPPPATRAPARPR
jgi:Domain of unknown function (DUF4157)/Bacterial toxin 4